ncbi:tryptophan-rich sensory protein [Candidatus Kaiserbacteria bacterium]|nr:MAG: tryptophan-rich sensory protein [Candidatus Kaiserbacteria bacterium]
MQKYLLPGTLVAYACMVVMNFLANGLPLNNRSTGDISDAYPNIFAPAGPAFSIWGLIYLLLGAYIIYQFVKKDKKTEDLFTKINPLFIATSLANISWIFAWHYDFIGLSVFIMATLLFLLIKIADILRAEHFTTPEKLFIWAPFSIYFGWITVASIANITVFLVSIGWNGFGIADFIWTSIILLVGALIGVLRMNKDKNVAYGIVLVWAYAWILFKHVSAGGFDGQYPSVIATAILCLLLFVFFIGRILYKKC